MSMVLKLLRCSIYLDIILPGSAILNVYALPSLGMKIAVGFVVLTPSLEFSTNVRFRFFQSDVRHTEMKGKIVFYLTCSRL